VTWAGLSGRLQMVTCMGRLKIKRFAMSEENQIPTPERIPFFQRVLENPFLLLFLGIAMPTVFYILWGVMEIATLPIAP
jgi:hypothetical protein